MKRLILTAGILAGLLGICLFGMHTVKSGCEEMTARLERIEQLCQREAAELSAECQAAEARWCEIEPKISFFINHDIARTVGESIAKLPPLSTVKDKEEFLSECRVARTKLLHLKRQESLSFVNVF